MRSPCATCPNMGDYDSDECRNCSKRLAYVAGIGDMRTSMPVEATDLCGRGSPDKVGRIEAAKERIRVRIAEEIEVNKRRRVPRSSLSARDPEPKEESMGEKPEFKICSRKDCEHGGKSQPLDSFNRCSKAKDGKYSYCKDCVRRIGKERRSKQEAAAEGPTPPATGDAAITDLFCDHPDLLDRLNVLAAEGLRTPRMQLLFLVKETTLFHCG